MARTLIAWSDRGVAGPRPSHHTSRPKRDAGPIVRLLEQPESVGQYEAATILATPAGEAPARELVDALASHIPRVELRVVPLVDPSDFTALFKGLEPVVQEATRLDEVDVLLSSGTPQMQTLWVILVKAGLLRARMLQVIPAAFVPSVHPRAIREVRLDIAGFPEIRALRDEVARLRAHSRVLGSHIIGDSAPMRTLANRLGRVAPSELPVLIMGETGSGKELIARSVHQSSHRSAGPLITENCGALTESVLSSELFGHDKGAFTGAAHAKRGLFELAHGGTLFLDEVGELSPKVQVNLLRVLQDGTLRRLGSERQIRVDVRVIAATHRDLAGMVAEGTFREDLFYRLQGATLHVPPLRERLDDLEALVASFLETVDSRVRVKREVWDALRRYRWPGNVRELRAEVMRWHVFCDRWVRVEDLDPSIVGGDEGPAAAHREPVRTTLADAVTDAERVAIVGALTETEGNLSKAARVLQIDRNTLKRKIRKLGVTHSRWPSGRPVEIG